MNGKISLVIGVISCLLLSSCMAATPAIYRWNSPGLNDSNLDGKEVSVEFTVVLSHNSGRVCYLNSDTDYANHFAAIINSEDFGKFEVKPEIYYLNKKIMVTGVLEQHKERPQMVLRSPLQIEVLK